MDELVYSYTNSLISKEELDETLDRLRYENQKMREADYDDERASLHLLDDIDGSTRSNTWQII